MQRDPHDSREQRKETGLASYCGWGWGHLRDYNAWAGGCIVESVTSAKGEPGLTSLSAVGTKGRGRDDAAKLSTHIQKWSQTPHCTI